MANANFYYFLDRTFKKGAFNFTEAIKLRKEASDKKLEEHFNPEPTSIYIGVTIQGKFLKVNTGLKVKPIDWGFEGQEFKKRKHPDWYENNNFLSNRISEIRKQYLNMKMESTEILPEQVKQLMEDTLKGKKVELKERDFFKIYDLFLIEKRKVSKKLTFQKYTILRLHLKTFEQHFYKLTLEKITKQFDVDFKYFSTNTKKHLNNTIARNVKCIKVFMRWALEHPDKFHNNLEFEKFTVMNDGSNIVALTYDEFETIRHLDLKEDFRLDKVRDVFVFQCLTGQRFSDIAHLKFKDLRKKDSEYEWVLWQIKNNRKEVIIIPLPDKAVEIVEKYREGRELLADDSVLPIISMVKMNAYLKDLGKLAKLNGIESKVNYSGINRVEKSSKKWEVLSTHCARRTFVTLSLQMGMRPEVVRSITGQTSQKTLAIYTGINESMKKIEFKDVWDKATETH